MTILAKLGKSKPTEVPYGSTLVPKSNDAAINEIKAIVAGVAVEMRRLAVAGADDDEPSSPLRRIRLGTEECLGREARETSQDMRNLEAQLNTVEALDPDLQLAGVDVTIVNETRQRQDDTIAAKVTAVRKRVIYHVFRSSREIDRDPETPNAWLTVFSIVLALAIEFGIGYWLYNDVSTDAIAAMGMAALLSLVVAATGLTTGFFGARGAFHGFGARERVLGSIFTAGGLFAILYLALMISHDRDHLASFAPDQDFIRRFDWALISHPADWFKYETVEGPLFLVILTLLAAFSLWKGMTGFSDVIPGYTRHYDNWREAENAVDDQVRALRQAAKAPIDREVALVDQKLGSFAGGGGILR